MGIEVLPDDRLEVVIPWGAGAYRFRFRWQAAAFAFLARRWVGWTSWEVLDREDKGRAVKCRSGLRADGATHRGAHRVGLGARRWD